MAFACHDTSFNGFTTPECCFIPDTVEEVPLNDCNTYNNSFVKKKTQYLPGEKLLISLNKQRKKNSDQISSLDIDRLASSLSRIF